jgi:hypothetical protein
MWEINLWAVLASTVVAIIIGSIWYGPLFGKKFMEASGMNKWTPEQQAAMKKKMMLSYAGQFIASFVLFYTVAGIVLGFGHATALEGMMGAFFIWLGIIVPVKVGDVAEVVSLLTAAPRAGQRFILNGGAVGYREFFTQVAQRMNKKVPGWRLPASLAWWAGAAEEFRSIILNREPMVTRQSAAMTNQAFQYDTRRVVEDLGFTFRPLTDTLDWACEAYRRNVTGNK